MLYRKFSEYLEKWFNNKNKKALYVDGARQIGKTTLIREFARTHYVEPIVEINFITTPSAKNIFKGDLNAQDLIDKISLFANRNLVPHKTLIFFDEVQECNEVRTAIKFLVEDGRFDYIESGSLLGVTYADIKSYAVGYEEIKTMYPLDFEEFVIANGIPQTILDKLEDCYKNKKAVDEFIHKKMLKLFSYYIIIGGMPEVVQEYVNNKNVYNIINNQKAILELYKLDISKYDKTNKGKIQTIFNAIPVELDNKNKRFVLTDLRKTARMERYERGFNWLIDAGVAHACYNISAVKQPIAINEQRNLFKLYLNDSGLLCAMCSKDIQYQIINDNLEINSGSILENVVATNLKSNGFDLYYYDKIKVGEVDFILEQNSELIPFEVKSGKDYKVHKALNNLLNVKEFNLKNSIVLCKGNVEVDDKVTYLPLYMLMFIRKDTRLDEVNFEPIF